jgi:FRG domain-containing protein
VELSTLKEFTGYIEDNFDAQQEHLFRGQPFDVPLLPSIARGRSRYESLLVAEEDMLEEFRRRSVPYVSLAPATLWDWMALAQRHLVSSDAPIATVALAVSA